MALRFGMDPNTFRYLCCRNDGNPIDASKL